MGEACKTLTPGHGHGATCPRQRHSLGQTQTSLAGIPHPELCPSAGLPGKLSHYGPAGGWTHSHVPAWPTLSGSEPGVATVRPACPVAYCAPSHLQP